MALAGVAEVTELVSAGFLLLAALVRLGLVLRLTVGRLWSERQL